MANALIVHGGGPTAVINASLYGAVMEAKAHPEIEHFYAAIGGSAAVLREEFLDLLTVPQEELELLKQTPGSAIGTSRDPMEKDDYDRMAQVIAKYGIRYAFFTGGNGSMDTCGKAYEACVRAGLTVNMVGIPKTMDNDISVTDHAPGFASAARYIAETTAEISQDVRSLPIHVCIIEAMGRNAGWTTAASALARSGDGDGPDLIYLPELPFDEEQFLRDVKRLHEEKGGVVVVASEGLKNADGKPIVDPIFQVGRAVYYGDVGSHLANLVIRKLGIKARSEKPGLAGRASVAYQSSVDREEAILVGATAVKAALAGENGVMVGLKRVEGKEYKVETMLIPIEQVMLEERTMPKEFIHPNGHDVTDAFVEWCRPLLGEPIRKYVTFKNRALTKI